MPAVKPTYKENAKNVSDYSPTLDNNVAIKESDTENGNAKNNSRRDSEVRHKTSTVGSERMGNLLDKFESGKVNDKKIKKSTPKMKYAGVESAKTKFIEEATKSQQGQANGPRGPKEFTPPPEGVAVGVLESNPKPRAPDVVTSDDVYEVIDLKAVGETTKTLREKFKNLEASGGQISNGDKSKTSSYLEEITSTIPETAKARDRWRDIESGKLQSENSIERPKVDIHDGYGGVYENEPTTMENIVRAGENDKSLPIGISARERREQFLQNASDRSTVKKEPVNLLELSGVESGIYENEPTRRTDVVRHDDESTDDYPPVSAKWASEAKNRFIQEATKSQELVHRTESFENGTDGTPQEMRYATKAKEAFLERQKQNEEAAKNKSRPAIIDIWGESCAHSGVFENTPAKHRADVVVSYGSEEEEEDEDQGRSQ